MEPSKTTRKYRWLFSHVIIGYARVKECTLSLYFSSDGARLWDYSPRQLNISDMTTIYFITLLQWHWIRMTTHLYEQLLLWGCPCSHSVGFCDFYTFLYCLVTLFKDAACHVPLFCIWRQCFLWYCTQGVGTNCCKCTSTVHLGMTLCIIFWIYPSNV